MRTGNTILGFSGFPLRNPTRALPWHLSPQYSQDKIELIIFTGFVIVLHTTTCPYLHNAIMESSLSSQGGIRLLSILTIYICAAKR